MTTSSAGRVPRDATAPTGDVSPARRAALYEGLARVARDLRDLPWRATRDPWAILVAEAMLQQTQVARVVPRWSSFLDRWPDAAACAAAPVGAVIEAWHGLGYNRRAVNLHAAARAIVADHDGVVPSGLDDLQALPGVGPYTARAVAVFAFEHAHGVVDSNVARVLARAVACRPLTARAAQALADDLVSTADPWAHGQALMEVGALHCRKRAPRCATCPLAAPCAWRQAGGPDGGIEDPAQATAGVANRQSRFEGSDRQGRGRLVTALRQGPVERGALPDVTGWADPARIDAMVRGLVEDGLAVDDDGMLRLPG